MGEWGEGERGAGWGVLHKRSCDGRWMQINPFSAQPEEPKTRHNRINIAHPAGELTEISRCEMFRGRLY